MVDMRVGQDGSFVILSQMIFGLDERMFKSERNLLFASRMTECEIVEEYRGSSVSDVRCVVNRQ